MVTAIFLGLMLVFEPKEDGLMKRPPRDPDEPILTFELLMRTGLVSLVMAAGAFWIFMHAQRSQGVSLEQARTMVINLIVMVELMYLFNCRSLIRSVFSMNPFSNIWIWVGSIAMIGLQLIFTYAPVMNQLFHAAPITLEHWLTIIGVSVGIFTLVESEKRIRAVFTDRRCCK